MLTLASIPDAAKKADGIFALETAMAKEQWSPEQSRDIAKLNDPEDLAGLKAKAPDVDWALMLKTAGLDGSPKVLMANNTALTAMGKIMVATPLQTWKDYLTFHFINSNAAFLPKAFDDASFAFFGKTLSGVPTQRDRWKRGVQLTNGALGEAVGAIYVAKYFPPAAQAQMSELIENVMDFARSRLGGGLGVTRQVVDLAPVLLHTVDELRLAAPDRDIRTDITKPLLLDCDPSRIAQLLSNLVANAVSHGAADQPIAIAASVHEGRFELSVANGGSEIPADLLAVLFQPFTREKARPSQNGLGLGLYIASEIAVAHGGVLAVTSDAALTRFTFTMPVH